MPAKGKVKENKRGRTVTFRIGVMGNYIQQKIKKTEVKKKKRVKVKVNV